MPLFRRSPRPTSDNTTSTHNTRSLSPERTERKKGILSSNRHNITHNPRASSSSPGRKRGIFSINHRTSSSSSESESQSNSKISSRRSGTKTWGNRLRNNKSRRVDHDPSIINARQKVSEAEQAEKDADRALLEARNHVQLARDNVRTLEQEAIDEGRKAKLKQTEARVIQKAAKSLGRHGP